MIRLYRLLLYCFPLSFRRRFADDMVQVFAARLAEARQTGFHAVALLWARTIADVLVHGVKECYAVIHARLIRGTVFDVRIALRGIRRRPGFAAAVVLTLALGVGATVAVFSVVRAVLINDGPYAEPDRVVKLWQTMPRARPQPFTVEDVAVIREQVDAFAVVGSCTWPLATVRGDGAPEHVPASGVTPEFFRIFGTAPIIGRTLGPADFETDERPVVLSTAVWRSQFGGSTDAIGRTIHVNREPWTVVGVMPASFSPPCTAGGLSGIWLPQRWTAADYASSRLTQAIFARLAPSIEIDQAKAQLDAVMAERRRMYNRTGYDGVGIERVGESEVASVRPGLLLVQGVVAFLFLITCANLVNLYLAHATTRGTEFGVRAALGAGRWRLIRQMLAEAMVLATAGGIAGVAIAYWTTPALVTMAAPMLPPGVVVAVYLPEVAIGLSLGWLTALVCGVVPVVSLGSAQTRRPLQENARATSGPRVRVLRNGLIAAEVLLAVVVLTGAGLLIRSFVNVVSLPMGFDTRNLVVADLSLAVAGFGSVVPQEQMEQHRADLRASILRIEQALARRLGATPFALADSAPYSSMSISSEVRIILPSGDEEGEWRWIGAQTVSASYFETLGIQLVRGRFPDASDIEDRTGAVVVSEQFAEVFGQGRDVLGSMLETRGRTAPIVGVVHDTKQGVLTTPPRPVFYRLMDDSTVSSYLAVMIRTPNVARMTSILQDVLREIDPDLPVIGAGTIADKIKLIPFEARRRFYLFSISIFAGLAGVLAAIGIYGVTAHVTGLRTREMGVRLAIGAQPHQVRDLVVRQGMVPVIIGLAGGVVSAWWTTRLLATNEAFQWQLYEVAPHDPWTFAITAGGLLIVALAACWIPGRRATRLDPSTVLRAE